MIQGLKESPVSRSRPITDKLKVIKDERPALPHLYLAQRVEARADGNSILCNNKANNERINVILRRVLATIVVVEKQ